MPNANHKPKGRFFRSVGLYLTDIVIDIATNGAYFWRKMKKGHRTNRIYRTYRAPTH